MRNEKAIASLLLCLIMAFSLTGCGRRSQLDTPEREAAPEIRRLPATQPGASTTEELDLEGVRGRRNQFILDSLL